MKGEAKRALCRREPGDQERVSPPSTNGLATNKHKSSLEIVEILSVFFPKKSGYLAD